MQNRHLNLKASWTRFRRIDSQKLCFEFIYNVNGRYCTCDTSCQPAVNQEEIRNTRHSSKPFSFMSTITVEDSTAVNEDQEILKSGQPEARCQN